MKKHLSITFYCLPCLPVKVFFLQKKNVGFLLNKTVVSLYTGLLFCLMLAGNNEVSAQAQVIGSFPEMQGGIENQTLGFLPVGTASYAAGATVTTYSRNNNTSSVTVEIKSTGGYASPKAIDWANGSTSSTIFTPTAAADAVLSNTSYVVQFFARRNTSTNNRKFKVRVYTNGGNYGEASTPQTGTTSYQKFTAIITTPVDAGTGKTGYIGIKPEGGSFGSGLTYLVDDICMYQGAAVDITAPDDATAPVITGYTSTSLDVSWTAPVTGVDGGGYVVVRYPVNPVAEPAPAANGIYAVGNSIGSGTVAYIGTGTSFTNTGLIPSTNYYYKVYVTDKAFNYSPTPVILSGFTGLATPTLVTFTTPPGCLTDRIILSWTGPLNYNATNNSLLAFLKVGSAVTAGIPTFFPSAYNPSTDFSAPLLPNYQWDAGAKCIYNGDGTNAAGDHNGLTITGLLPNTTYHVLVYNVVDAAPTYSVGANVIGTTLATPVAEPSNQVTVFAKGTVTTASISPTWVAAAAGAQAPLGYVIQASNTAIPADPADATDLLNQTDISGGTASAKVTPNTATVYAGFTGFSAGTMYYFRNNSYTNSGSCINYKATGPAMNVATLPNAVTLPSMSITGTTATISWTTAAGYNNANHTTLVFVKPVSAVTVGSPSADPSTYIPNVAVGSGTTYEALIDPAARCVYNGDGSSVNINSLVSGAYHVLILTVVTSANSDGTYSYSAYSTTSASMGITYTWNGSVNSRWTRPANWTPARATIASTDILIVNTGTILTIDSVSFSNETIAQLQVTNNTTLTLRTIGGTKTLTINNNNGLLNSDLIITSGSTVTMGFVPGGLLNVVLGTNTTADISGRLNVLAGCTYNTNAAGDLTTVSGTLRNLGTVTCTASNMLVTLTGTYDHAINGGTLPTATWNPGSTCLISGITSAVSFAGHAQTFSKFVWDCASQSTALPGPFVLGAGVSNATPCVIADSFIVKRTGATGVLQITSTGGQRDFTCGNYFQFGGTVAITYNTNDGGIQRSLTVNNTFYVTDSLASNTKFQIINNPGSTTNISGRLYVKGNLEMHTTLAAAILEAFKDNILNPSLAELWFNGSSAQNARFSTISGSIDFINNHTGSGVTLLSNAVADRFKFNQGDFYINGNTLTINNAVSYPAPGTGTLGGSSASNLILGLNGAAGELRFTPGFRTLKDFTQLAGNQASLGTELAITAGTSAGRDSLGIGASLETNDNLILRSDADGTARMARIPVNGSGVALATITEKVTVERYLPMTTTSGARRWRLLTAPFTSTSAPTINAAWQEGVSNPDRNNPAAFDPRPGYGTHITKSTTWAADGYDQGSTNNPSIYYYNAGSWTAPANTNTVKITDNSGCYMLFARGDRSIVISNQLVAAVPTTLEPKGLLHLGRVTIPAAAAGTYQTVGNPYASQIKLDNVVFNDTLGISKTVYLWDPKTLGSSNVGKFITCSGNGSSYIYTGHTSAYDTRPGVIESSGAFMVKSNGGNIVFNESDKTMASSTIGMASRPSRQPGPTGKISTLYADLMAVKNGEPLMADGIAVSFNKNYKNSIDNLDAQKLSAFNTKEDLGIKSNGEILSIERRKEVVLKDTIFLNISRLNSPTYQFNLRPVDFDETYSAYLEDNYTKNTAVIDLRNGSAFDFSITADSASFAANRFHIIFTRTKTDISTPVNPGLSVYPNPVQNGQVNLQMSNMADGEYNIKLINNLGQVIQTQSLVHQKESAAEQLYLGKSLASGIYKLQVIAPDNTTTVISVILQ